MYNLITDAEKEMMMNYIKENVGTPTADFDWLFRFWANAKTDLAELLGGKLSVSEQIEYEMPVSTIANKFWNQKVVDSTFSDIIYKYNQFVNENFDGECNFFNLRSLVDENALAQNQVRTTFELAIDDEKTLKFFEGMKPFKALKKLNNIYHFWTEDESEYFRNTCSRMTNQKKLTGDLVISIHPLDYMTMSDNENGWSSCMSWREQGCYRMGTVEMMNSPMVVVAYLTDKTMPMEGGGEWNSKKWRQLFIVNKDMITSIKAYPYVNVKFTKKVMEKLRELGEKNWGIHYSDEYITFSDGTPQDYGYNIEFETYFMYNDFGCTTHYMNLAEGTDFEEEWSYCNYSGEPECMLCGGVDNDFPGNYGDEADFLACKGCDTSGVFCEECGNRIRYEDDEWWLDDECFCYGCYQAHAIAPFNDEEREAHNIDNCEKYELVDEEGRYIKNIYWYSGYRMDKIEDYLEENTIIQNRQIPIEAARPEFLEKFENYDYYDIR